MNMFWEHQSKAMKKCMNNVSYEWIRLGMLLLAVLSLPVTGKERSPELWRTYMHGIVPDQAVSISIREIVFNMWHIV